MLTVSTTEELDRLKAGAVLVMFGSARCSVCTAIRPRIDELLAERFPGLPLAYVSCEDHADLCAQHSVFSLPALKLFLDNRISLELARSFSLKELEAGLERSYAPWQDTRLPLPPS